MNFIFKCRLQLEIVNSSPRVNIMASSPLSPRVQRPFDNIRPPPEVKGYINARVGLAPCHRINLVAEVGDNGRIDVYLGQAVRGRTRRSLFVAVAPIDPCARISDLLCHLLDHVTHRSLTSRHIWPFTTLVGRLRYLLVRSREIHVRLGTSVAFYLGT